jgi:hypothetical protein
MTRFATSVLDQMKHIWKPYMFGALGAVALALVVAAAGGLFLPAETPRSEPIGIETVLPTLKLVIAVLVLLLSISVLLRRFRTQRSLRSMIEMLKDYRRQHD